VRIVRDGLLAALIGLLVLILCLFAVVALVSMASDFAWHVTPLGRLILSALVGLLMVSSAVMAAVRPPRAGLIAIAVVLALVEIPLLSFAPGQLSQTCLMIVGAGILCLVAGGLIGGLRAKSVHAKECAVLLGVTAVLVAFGLLAMAVINALPQLDFILTTEVIHQNSPDGTWTVIGDEWDEGALGGSVTISVQRVYAGFIEQARGVYSGDWGARPVIRWVDSRTVSIGGRTLDVYRDPPIADYR